MPRTGWTVRAAPVARRGGPHSLALRHGRRQANRLRGPVGEPSATPEMPSGTADARVSATGGAGNCAADHDPLRPLWDCRSCGKTWPCAPARESLSRKMDRVALAIYMWLNLEDAVVELSATPPSELFDRFIAWTR
jgi:hypothetical protein